MASISSLISFIVLLLAAYSYSAPVVSDLQATTSISKVENVTIDFQVQDLVILVRDGNSTAPQYKRPSATVGSSSSSSSEEDHTRQTEQTTDELSTRASKFTSVPLSTETNPKREVDAEVNDSFADADDKREVDADTNDKREVDADTNDKREVDAEANDSFADADDKREVDADANESFAESDEKRAVTDDSLSTKTITKHGIAVQSVDSSTVADQTSTVEGTSDPSTSKMIHHKRAFDGSQWLSADSDAQMKKRALDGSQWLSADSDAQMKKRALDGSQWLSADSDAQMNKRAFDGSQWLSADVDAEANKRSVESMDESSGESSENFNERAIQSSSVMTNPKREMDQSSSLSDDSSEAFNRRAIGSVESGDLTTVVAVKIQSKSATDEQLSSSTVEPVSSTGIIPDQSSSTSESETTVASPVSSGTTAKILAIIPGKLSKPQYVIQPVSEAPVVAEHMQLSQGQNQTITETKKPNY